MRGSLSIKVTALPTRVLLAGVSTRAAAESAARAGFAVTAIDAFGDLDQHPLVRSLSTGRDFGVSFSASAAVRGASAVSCDVTAYLSNFENHPRAVAALARGRELWGNAPAVLRRARDPWQVAETLQRRGMRVPALSAQVTRSTGPGAPAQPAPPARYLVKPVASGGGHGIHEWRPGACVPRHCYVQAFLEGTPGSIVFVSAARSAVPLGISRQLIGDPAFGAAGYRYCGNILAPAGDPQFSQGLELARAACELASIVTEEFALTGVNGIDFVARDGIPYLVEINPRWTASMELIERTYGVSVFGAHAAACGDSRLSTFDLLARAKSGRAVGKAIVFARHDVTLGDTRAWLDDATIRDVPHPQEQIRAGRPVCTVFADAIDAAECHKALVTRAASVYAKLAHPNVRVKS